MGITEEQAIAFIKNTILKMESQIVKNDYKAFTAGISLFFESLDCPCLLLVSGSVVHFCGSRGTDFLYGV